MSKTIEQAIIPQEIQERWLTLSPPQRQFVLNYLANGGDATVAYLEAGYAVKDKYVASAGANRLLKSVKVSSCLYAILKANRLTPEYADLKHFEALEAKETKFFAHEGVVVETREVIAWAIRLQALDMLHKIHRRYGKNGNGNGLGGETHYHYTVNVQANEQELASTLLAELRSRPAVPAA